MISPTDPLFYADEKLSNTVDTLATHPGTIKERLEDAIVYHFIHVGQERLPTELRALYRSIYNDVARRAEPIGDEGTVAASVRSLSEDEAVAVAQRILALASRVSSASE